MCYGYLKHIYLYLTIHNYRKSGLFNWCQTHQDFHVPDLKRWLPGIRLKLDPLLILALDFNLRKKK